MKVVEYHGGTGDWGIGIVVRNLSVKEIRIVPLVRVF